MTNSRPASDAAYIAESDLALLRQVLAPFPSGPAVLSRIEAVWDELQQTRKLLSTLSDIAKEVGA